MRISEERVAGDLLKASLSGNDLLFISECGYAGIQAHGEKKKDMKETYLETFKYLKTFYVIQELLLSHKQCWALRQSFGENKSEPYGARKFQMDRRLKHF